MRWEYEDKITFDITPELFAASKVIGGVRMYIVNDDGSPVYGARNCPGCDRPFVPLNTDRTLCVSCLKQQRADSNLQSMAFGKDFR